MNRKNQMQSLWKNLFELLDSVTSDQDIDDKFRYSQTMFFESSSQNTHRRPIEKPDNSDSEDLLYLSQILEPVCALFEDKNNASPISFMKFVRFIHRCNYQPKEAASIVSESTDGVPNLLSILNESYSFITNPHLKSGITRIKAALKKKIDLDTLRECNT